MMTATPSTCQPTEMLLSMASPSSPKMLSSVTNARMSRNSSEGLAQDVLGVAEVDPEDVDRVEAEQVV